MFLTLSLIKRSNSIYTLCQLCFSDIVREPVCASNIFNIFLTYGEEWCLK